MTASDQTNPESGTQALTALRDSPAFQRLQQIAESRRPFNFFEVASLPKREEIHSRLLAFLLDARRPHGLGAQLCAALLRTALGDGVDWAACSFQVERERWRIDILLRDYRRQIAVIIENKVLSSEHGDQLVRYRGTLGRELPGWTIYAIYLSPRGIAPSDPDYRPLSYGALCAQLEALAGAHGLPDDTHLLLTHYTQMLRSAIVNDSPEVRRLCLELHQSHGAAIQLLLANLPNPRTELYRFFHAVIEQEQRAGRLRLIYTEERTREEIAFVPSEWDRIRRLRPSHGSYGGRPLFFSIYQPTGEERARLCLWLTHGRERWKENLREAAGGEKSLLTPYQYDDSWYLLFEREIAAFDTLKTEQIEQLMERARQVWQQFLDQELGPIDAFVRRHLASGA